MTEDNQYGIPTLPHSIYRSQIFDIDNIRDSPEQNLFIEAFRWLEERICQPHRALGRDGNVCPFAGKSIRANAMRFVALYGARGSAKDAQAACLQLIDLFWNIFPFEPVEELQSLITIFPDLREDEAAAFIDGGHQVMRHQFLAAGLALGEFHSASKTQGVHNPDFSAMWAPLPVFVIRRVLIHDALFVGRGIILLKSE